MPKTIAITPSWYWPSGVTRVVGVPPFRIGEQLVDRWARHRPDDLALIDAERRLTGRELAHQVEVAAAALGALAGEGRVLLAAGPSVEGAVLFLALVAAGIPTVLVAPGQPIPAAASVGIAAGDAQGQRSLSSSGLPVLRLDEVLGLSERADRPFLPGLADRLVAVASGDDLAWHSHRSLLGGAVSLQTFLEVGPQRPWLTTVPISTWEGIYGLTVPLAAGASVVLAPPGDSALDAIVREGVGRSFWELGSALAATRDAKRQVKSIRGVQDYLVLAAPRSFDPDDRRRVGKLFGSPALTTFGLPETGPIFASHPSWYLDESIGIPLTNAFVVPVDPRSGNPVPTLWELVESAMVAVWCPGLLEGYEQDPRPERFRDGRYLTGIMASSDANGMVYLLPD